MELGIVTTAYYGYGKFIPQWAEAISNLTIPPAAVTVALGPGHNFQNRHRILAQEFFPDIKYVEYKHPPNMGVMRNVAVKHTETEWIQYLSVDDIILPWAVEQYQKVEDEADFISIRWRSRATWEKEPVENEHTPRLPYEMALKHQGRGFINNQSPYRRWLWENRPYEPHDYPNAPFIADCVEQGARFVRTEKSCTVYLRRLDSHCGKNLGRRATPDHPAKIVPAERARAKREKARAERRIEAYYLGGGS